jgi:hypothetical protein
MNEEGILRRQPSLDASLHHLSWRELLLGREEWEPGPMGWEEIDLFI